MAAEDDREISYYRAVEDLFATLRGVPHMLSPKDFHLLRSWWREGIPLAAVSAGATEVFARRRERGEIDPVVSLSYCRHAVKAHARRIADMRVGGHDAKGEPPILDTASAVALGDLDSDGDLDAYITASYSGAETNRVWANSGSGTYTDSGQALGTNASTDVALGDLDGDGDLDAYVANNAQGNRVWING